MPLREQRHPGDRRTPRPRRGRRLLRWVPEVLVLLLVAAAFATEGLDLSDKLFGPDRDTPAEVLPPLGLELPSSGPAAPVASVGPDRDADPAKVRAAIGNRLNDPDLGKHVAVVVTDLDTGQVLFRKGATAVVPASTMKLLTSAAALESLGPQTRFHTTVRLVGHRLSLVGGGDPYLMSSLAAARGQYPARGDLGTLAARTATALKAQGITWVRLTYDATLFTGPRVNPTWPANYLPDDVVPPITALWADQGKGSDGRYVADPAAAAGGVFAKALARAGIAVRGPVAGAKTPATAVEVARIASAPVYEIVEHTLAVSDNNAAEVLAHQVGLAERGDASFAGGAAAVTQVLTGLGVPLAGTMIKDGSGLSRDNRLTPEALLGVLRTAASADAPELRAVITGLPVAGFTGSLQYRFDKAPVGAKGLVRAKTGTLTGVHGLAGVITDQDGDRMAFVAIADRVPVAKTLAARAGIDMLAAVLGACRCGSADGPGTSP